MTIQELVNDMVRLTPDEGKVLYCRLNNQTYSVAEVKTAKVKFFSEIDKPVEEE